MAAQAAKPAAAAAAAAAVGMHPDLVLHGPDPCLLLGLLSPGDFSLEFYSELRQARTVHGHQSCLKLGKLLVGLPSDATCCSHCPVLLHQPCC